MKELQRILRRLDIVSNKNTREASDTIELCLTSLNAEINMIDLYYNCLR